MRKIIHRYTVLLLTVLLVGTGIALADTDVIVLGDVNSDGSVNEQDVTALVNYLHGSGTVDAVAADVNRDDAIDIADVTAINNIITSGTSDKGTASTLFFPATTVEKTYGDATFTNQLVRSGSTGAITYTSSATGVATVNMTTGEVTIQGAGTAIITATLADNGGISGTFASYTLNVAKATNSLTTTPVLASATQEYTGSPVTLVTTEGAALFGSVEYSTTSATEGFSTTVPTATNAGDYTVWYRVPGTASYTAIDAVDLGTVTISAATISSVTIADLTAPVKGETLDTEASCSTAGIASVSAVTWMIGGEAASGTAVANKVYTASVTLTANSNYAFAETPTANEVSGKTAVVTRTDDTHITVNYTFDATAKSDLALTLSLEGWTYGAAANTTPTLTGNDGGGSVTYQYKLASAGDGDYTTFDAGHYPASAGNYTLKASVAANGDYNGGETTAAFTISKKPLTVTAEAKSRDYGTENPALTYTHGDLATGDNESVFSGALACVATTESSVGTYDITQGTLSAGDNYQIAFTGAVLTVNKATPTLTTLPAAVDGDLTYNGETKQVFTTGTIPDGTGTLKYKVTTDDTRPTSTEEFTTTIPSQTNAGTYYLWYYVEGDGNHTGTEINNDVISKTINKVAASVTNAPTGKTSLTYTGEAQELVDATSAAYTGGTLVYSKTENGTYGAASTITETNAGTYSFWYKVQGDGNHDDSTPVEITGVVIDKANPTYTAPSYSALTYTGGVQDLVSAGSTEHGTFTYSTTQEGTYSETIPQGTASGNYTVWYKLTGDANHNDVAAIEVPGVSIGKKEVTVNGITASNKTYDGNTTATLDCTGATISGKVESDDLTVTATGTFTDENVGTGKNVTISGITLGGSSAANYKLATSGNQESTTADITAASFTPVVTLSGWTYGSPNDPSVGDTNTSGGIVTYYYKTGDAEWTTTQPTDVGTHKVKASIAASSNYDAAESAEVEFTITQKALTITAKAQTISYGNSIATGVGQVTAEGLVDGDALTAVILTSSTNQVTTSGTITPSAATTTKGIGNYSVTYNTGTLTITRIESATMGSYKCAKIWTSATGGYYVVCTDKSTNVTWSTACGYSETQGGKTFKCGTIDQWEAIMSACGGTGYSCINSKCSSVTDWSSMSGIYWSSTESSSMPQYAHYFLATSCYITSKSSDNLRVRLVSAF